MSETITQVRHLLESGLRELEREARQLRESLKALDGHPSRDGVRSRGGRVGRGRRPGKRRAARGQRREEFLAVVKGTPGATPSEVARQIGVPATQAHGLARQLVRRGEISKVGKGYRVK